MDFRTSATRELSTVLDRLIQAAETAAVAARAEATAEAQLTIDALNAQRQTVQQTLDGQIDARQAVERKHAALEAEKAALADTVEKEKAARQQTFEKEKAALRDALEKEKAARQDEVKGLRAELATLRTDTTSLRTEAATMRAEANALRAEGETTALELQTQLDEAHRAAIEATARANEWRADQGRSIRDQAISLLSRTFERLHAVTAAFAQASSEDEVLAAVVESLATEFPRVALFKVGLNRLDVLQHVGFSFPSDYTHLVIPQGVGTVLDRAVTSGQIELVSTESLAAFAGTPFGGTPAAALALPIDLDGDLCAVLYADDSDQPHQTLAAMELRRSFALLLRQLAAPLLQRLPAETKAIAELREYAAHLVAELENMYGADAAAQKKGPELRRRLQDNLECARGIYAQRVSSEAPAAAALLEEELALAASVAHATPFGRDLTALLGAAEPRAAEA